jgi:hypothetical protein
MNQHSGKKLSDVPFADLFVGMAVVSYRGNGRITDLFEKVHGHKLEALKIVYDNHTIELDLQKTFKHVRIK